MPKEVHARLVRFPNHYFQISWGTWLMQGEQYRNFLILKCELFDQLVAHICQLSEASRIGGGISCHSGSTRSLEAPTSDYQQLLVIVQLTQYDTGKIHLLLLINNMFFQSKDEILWKLLSLFITPFLLFVVICCQQLNKLAPPHKCIWWFVQLVVN